MVFKKTTKMNGKFKSVMVINGEFIDAESGEKLDLAQILSEFYGISAFSISTSKQDIEEMNEYDA